MESAAGLIKLKATATQDLEEWREALTSRSDEVLRSLRNEGVVVESWFQIEIGGEPYLLWFMRAKSIAQARETFLASEQEIDAYHMDMMSKMAESQIEAVSIVDLSADP